MVERTSPLAAGIWEVHNRGGGPSAPQAGPLARPSPRLEPPIPPARKRACGLAAQPALR